MSPFATTTKKLLTTLATTLGVALIPLILTSLIFPYTGSEKESKPHQGIYIGVNRGTSRRISKNYYYCSMWRDDIVAGLGISMLIAIILVGRIQEMEDNARSDRSKNENF